MSKYEGLGLVQAGLNKATVKCIVHNIMYKRTVAPKIPPHCPKYLPRLPNSPFRPNNSLIMPSKTLSRGSNSCIGFLKGPRLLNILPGMPKYSQKPKSHSKDVNSPPKYHKITPMDPKIPFKDT